MPVYIWSVMRERHFCITINEVIDAVPKKRGPKTDVLEALLKRVDGLERRLKDEKKSHSPNTDVDSLALDESPNGDAKPKRPQLDTTNVVNESAVYSPTPIRSACFVFEDLWNEIDCF